MKKKSSKKKAPVQKRVIIMDEVDGMGAGDRSGMSELIQMIKKSKVPIVSIADLDDQMFYFVPSFSSNLCPPLHSFISV